MGKKPKLEVTTDKDIYLTVPKRKKSSIKAVAEYNSPIEAPVEKGDKIGVLNVYESGELKKEDDVFAGEKIKKANIFSRRFK